MLILMKCENKNISRALEHIHRVQKIVIHEKCPVHSVEGVVFIFYGNIRSSGPFQAAWTSHYF